MTATARRLADGRRLHLQHGPIDLIIEAWGAEAAVRAAYERAIARFPTVLPELVAVLPTLKSPLPSGEGGARTRARVRGSIATDSPRTARRDASPHPDPLPKGEGISVVLPGIPGSMIAACWPYRDRFITPMAAVAGAVADAVLAVLTEAGDLARAYVNNGGDIAFHLAPGERLTAGLVADVAHPALHGTIALDHTSPVRGLATSGAGGRSFSRGIADAVTILSCSAAEADAAATIVANAVDVDHPAIRRAPANRLRDDTDLGDISVTVEVGALPADIVAEALASGEGEARRLLAAGLIDGAVLVLKGETVVVTNTQPSLRGAQRRSNPEGRHATLDCFAEPVLGPAFGRTRGLAMTG